MLPFPLFLFSTLLFVHSSLAGYVLEDDYSGANFFSMFNFFTGADPTNGFVDYVDQATATSESLIQTYSNGSVYIGVDSTNVAQNPGRQSVRIESTKAYGAGSLIILDLLHMPDNACGTWPAFWTLGPGTWPAGGEIDIIEGVNLQTGDSTAMHTTTGCTMQNTGFSGQLTNSNCDVNAPNQAKNAGCSITTSEADTFGTGFNAAQGGVYAMEFLDTAISIYHFPRASIPADITSGTPDTAGWGMPLAQYASSADCDLIQFVQPQNILFDITFCGDWAGNVWSSSSCAAMSSSCQNYVQNQPSAFAGTYWTINSMKVYSGGSSGGYADDSNGVNTIPGANGVSTIPGATGVNTIPGATGLNTVAAGNGLNRVAGGTGVIPIPSATQAGAATSWLNTNSPAATNCLEANAQYNWTQHQHSRGKWASYLA